MTEAEQADELARRLLLLTFLVKRVEAARGELKDRLERLIKPGTMLRPQLAGSAVGSVSYSKGAPSAQIYDWAAFTHWCLVHHPGRVDLVPTVDPEFAEAVVVASGEAGVPVSPQGEVDVAGVRIATGTSTISVRPVTQRAAELWAEIRDQLPALTGDGSSEA